MLLLRNGTTAVRSHVDILHGDDPLRGIRAELLAVRGTGVADMIANAPADRIVIHDGVVLSRSETHTWMAV